MAQSNTAAKYDGVCRPVAADKGKYVFETLMGTRFGGDGVNNFNLADCEKARLSVFVT
jgi:microcystin-dependent protein